MIIDSRITMKAPRRAICQRIMFVITTIKAQTNTRGMRRVPFGRVSAARASDTLAPITHPEYRRRSWRMVKSPFFSYVYRNGRTVNSTPSR